MSQNSKNDLGKVLALILGREKCLLNCTPGHEVDQVVALLLVVGGGELLVVNHVHQRAPDVVERLVDGHPELVEEVLQPGNLHGHGEEELPRAAHEYAVRLLAELGLLLGSNSIDI